MESIASVNEQVLSAPEKAVDFFIAFCKAEKKKKKLLGNGMLFGLPADLKPASIKPTEKDSLRSDEIIKALYDFGKKHSIKLPSFRSFREDAIVSVLKDEILLFEISWRILTTTENNLAYIGISLTNEIFDQMGVDEISETFARQMLLIYLKTTKEPIDYLTREIHSPDPFQVNAQYFDRRYYYKQKGQFLPFEADTSPDHFANYYLQNGKDLLHCKTNKKQGVVEITIYQSATIENQKLITNENTIEETFYLPTSEIVSFFAELNKATVNDLDFEESSGEDGIPISSYIEAFQCYATDDKTELAKHCFFHFYRILNGGFPTWTEEQTKLMTVFICVQLGVLRAR